MKTKRCWFDLFTEEVRVFFHNHSPISCVDAFPQQFVIQESTQLVEIENISHLVRDDGVSQLIAHFTTRTEPLNPCGVDYMVSLDVRAWRGA